MSDELVVFGAGGQARETAEVAHLCGWRVTAFVDVVAGGRVADVPVVAETDCPAGVSHAVGIGDPGRRRAVHEQHAPAGGWPTLVHPAAVVSAHASVDATAGLVQAAAVISCDARVGPGVLVNYGATVGHDAVLREYSVVLPGASISGGATIGAGALVGSRAVVLPGVKVGRGARVGAGAVVTKDVPDHSTVVGVPATVINTREAR